MLIGVADPGFQAQSAQGLVLQFAGRHVNGDYEATFELSEPQPSLPVLLASAFYGGLSLSCSAAGDAHQSDRTGPQLVEFKRGKSIRLVRNPDHFKKDRPYLDEITVRTIKAAPRACWRSRPAITTYVSFHISVPLFKDIKAQAPNAICEIITTGTLINLMVNRVNPPFDNADIGKAMSPRAGSQGLQYLLDRRQGFDRWRH